MARPKKRLNDQKAEVIEKNHLVDDTIGHEEEILSPVKVFKDIPEMTTIIFRNDRDPGVPLEFHYASKTHPLNHYTLEHGKQYTLPVEVVEEIESKRIPIYVYKKGPDDLPVKVINGYKYMFTCKQVRA